MMIEEGGPRFPPSGPPEDSPAPAPVVAPPARPARPSWRIGSTAATVVASDLLALTAMVAADRAASLRTFLWLLLVPVFAGAFGSYRRRVTPTLRSEVPRLMSGTFAATLTIGLIWSESLATFRVLLPAALGALVLGRAAAYRIQAVARSRNMMPTIIVGAGEVACKLAETIEEHPGCGMRVVGLVDGHEEALISNGVKVIGRLAHLDRLIDTHGVQRVIVAFGSHRETEMVDVLRACRRRDLDLFILPRLFELGVGGGTNSGDELWGFPLTRISRGAMPGPSWLAKRLLDVSLAALALIALSPLLVAVAIGVKLDSPGPVFFKQKRVGQKGRVVNVLKFRSMPVLTDSDTRWKVDHQTISWFGHVLRKTSIDELPQLINVLKGDMSIVGPRPEREHYVAKFNNEILRYGARHRVPVGLTGWAQVHGLRGDTSIVDRARFDNYYIEHWSVWLDLVIMARTVGHVLRTVIGWSHADGDDAPVVGQAGDLSVATPDTLANLQDSQL